MNTRRIIEIILAVALLLGVLLVLWFLFRRPAAVTPQPVVTAPTETVPTATDRPATTVPPVAAVEIPAPTAVGARATAETFIERFGSYSSESDFANVTDVKAMATASFSAQLDQVAAEARRTQSKKYYGVSTKVITLSVTEAGSTATITATTQRQESIDSPTNTSVRYQDITVRLIKEGETWRVDGYQWGA